MAHFLADEYGLSPQRITVVPHGVDCAAFHPLVEHVGNDTDHLLAVGRLTEQKGFELLIRSLPSVIATRPTTRLTIVGDGGRRESLEQLVVDLGLSNVVTLSGVKTKAQLPRYFSQAALLVIPSQFEPFGLVGLEAMACGCPVIAIAPTGASEYLEPCELTTNYSPSELGSTLSNQLGIVQKRTGLRDAVRARAERRTWEKAADAYRRLYLELMP